MLKLLAFILMGISTLRISKKYENPFLHYQIDNFLSEEELFQANEIYSSLSFYPKHTDLFNFLQTNELNQIPELKFLRTRLFDIAQELGIEKIDKIDMFASYYKKDDYLLCHDDLISTRKFAYSFYLEDYDSGELILFNSSCDKIDKKIKVKRNSLVLFEVSKISWHEVASCETDGRKAFTGWLHCTSENDIKSRLGNIIRNRILENVENYKRILFQKIEPVDPIIYIPDFRLKINSTFLKETGPFCDRRIAKVKGSETILDIPGLEFVDKESFHIRKNDYILLNDEVNDVKNYNYYTLFHFNAFDDEIFNVISFVNNKGEIEFELECYPNTLYVIEGNIWKWFIERSKKEFLMEYFIYKIMSDHK